MGSATAQASMTTRQTIPANLHLQWLPIGRDHGAWRATDGSGEPQFLDRWALAGPETRYSLSFESKQNAGHPYVVFATLTDSAGGPVRGLRIAPNQGADATTLALTVTGDVLALTAGELAADEVVLNIDRSAPATQAATLHLTWAAGRDGRFAWTYRLGSKGELAECPRDGITVVPDAKGHISVTIDDRGPGAANHTCAVFYAQPGSAIGTVGLTDFMDQDGGLELEFTPDPDHAQVRLEVFAALQTSKASILERR